MVGRSVRDFLLNRRRGPSQRAAASIAWLLAATLAAAPAALADLDNKGTEFLMTFLPNVGGETLELHLTAEVATQVTVEFPVGSVIQTVAVAPGAITVVTIPAAASIGWPNAVAAYNAVRASAASEFVAYMVNRLNATSDAAVALPVDVFNNDYIVADYIGLTGSVFGFVAESDGTVVTVTPTAALTNGAVAGVPFDVNLARGQGFVATANSGLSLSGTTIHSNKRIGMTNGNRCTNVPTNVSACDHLFEVAQPVQTWGTTIPVANLPLRTGGSIYRVYASANGTTVNLDGVFLANLNAGGFVEVPGSLGAIAGGHLFTASAPIFVVQFMTGLSFAGNSTGDPAMGNMIPSEQYLTDYTFSTVGGAQFAQNFLTVIADDRDLATITLDGVAIGAVNFTSIPGSGFSWAHVALTSGTHATSSGRGHGITVEGYNSFDSYLYPGGALIFPINVADENPPVCTGNLVDGVFAGSATDNRPSEDSNNNNELDDGEDLNDNGIIDVDTGIFDLSLAPGAVNVQLTASFSPGDPVVNFSVSPIQGLQGSGNVIARDGAANECSVPVVFGGEPDDTDPECDLAYDPDTGTFTGTASDSETGIASIVLTNMPENLSVSSDFSPGDSPVPFSVDVVDPTSPARGKLVVMDGAGNECSSMIDLPVSHPYVDESGWGEDVAVQATGDQLYAWLAAGEAGTLLYDVTDPTNPTYISTHVPDAGTCKRAKAPYPAFYADAVAIVQGGDLPFESPIFDGDIALFAAGPCGLIAADITDPLDVEQVLAIDTPSWAEAVDVYIDAVNSRVTVYVASFWGGLRIYGQTDPVGNPTAVGQLGTWGVNDQAIGPAIDLGVEQRNGRVLVHLMTDLSLRTVDVTDPANPFEIGRFDFDPALLESGEGMTIVGDRAFVALWQGGLLVLDISDPTNPTEVQTVPTDLAIYSVATNASGTSLYAAEGMFGVRTFWVNPDGLTERIPSPIDIADGGWAWSLAERNRFVYVSYGRLGNPDTGGLQILEYTDGVECGLGFEVAFLIPPLVWLRKRRRRA